MEYSDNYSALADGNLYGIQVYYPVMPQIMTFLIYNIHRENLAEQKAYNFGIFSHGIIIMRFILTMNKFIMRKSFYEKRADFKGNFCPNPQIKKMHSH